MKIKEMRQMHKDELNVKLDELKKELMEFTFKRKTGIEKPHMMRVIKKDIARIMTVLNDKSEVNK
ncbi:MAG: 50S ribosomal protein L29 [Candidatus Omnitrophica bacterium]|nr:50S ribosomal protein L29 [Candidatus Omnitrophota bacterium]MDD5080743.1 50S ribosomal protein L29 [Candidatus Omnitrophota bacterium]MDD5441255.1 50S ribosomal protein L29 [Candidatus Omnitrophota bacterium]